MSPIKQIWLAILISLFLCFTIYTVINKPPTPQQKEQPCYWEIKAVGFKDRIPVSWEIIKVDAEEKNLWIKKKVCE